MSSQGRWVNTDSGGQINLDHVEKLEPVNLAIHAYLFRPPFASEPHNSAAQRRKFDESEWGIYAYMASGKRYRLAGAYVDEANAVAVIEAYATRQAAT